MRSKIGDVNKANSDAIKKEFSRLEVVNYDTVSELLPKLLAQGQLTLDHSIYTPQTSNTGQGSQVGRYLIYDHPDKTNPFSIWAFAFSQGQKTLIHDHEYKGTVIVLDEPISEKYYRPHGDQARLIRRVDRYRFHSNSDDLTTNFVHQLERRKDLGPGISVTLHIYNMEALRINLEGDIVDRRNLRKIYIKEKIQDKSSIPPYEKEEYYELGDNPRSVFRN